MHVSTRGPLRMDKLNLASLWFTKEKYFGWHYECNVWRPHPRCNMALGTPIVPRVPTNLLNPDNPI
ncbi:hypothetical protein H5410_036923 [Solanum commersonii]|uniref:Uncharacterized protein n=1 Tax=Solanum commersonii TaxID=4109 RepID=A0A9J5Y4V0_SOLCO|nr:hypothetical protein H5410_036923 [Solanum commersonii]